MAGDTPQTGDTTTRLVRRHGGNRVRCAPLKFARRPSRGDASQPSRCLKEKETKGDGGTFGTALSPIIDAPQAPEIMEAKPGSPLPTHTADVTTTTRGSGGSSRRCTIDSRILQRCGLSALRVARPGLEPGTPRFSVPGQNPSNRAEIPAWKLVSTSVLAGGEKSQFADSDAGVWALRSATVPKRIAQVGW
jgi:hypothetical protein